ncbi:putative competence-damage inducible protein [Andreesenia angusta]|uniref:Molybdopterin molybdenumtransferase n=1 Tax=Andreesenia angusta TaxID=39480 RepID=A0A1S1V4J2_9FIRM|nr:molybdopterin-binding protein [Andreesenia angusta]OHW61320.1 putative competence-damage inducible protein [Andreesenia angusta]
MKKKMNVEDSVGSVLAYDLTKIVPGEFKGAAFRKGHIIRPEDVEAMKKMGKYHIYAIELGEDEMHENEASQFIAERVTGDGISFTEPNEGKVSLVSKHRGVLKINVEALEEVNDIDMVIFSTMHNNSLVEEGTTVAGTRIIPLTIKSEYLEKLRDLEEKYGKIIEVVPLEKLNCGIVVTGTEVFEGLITDKFGPVLEQKIRELGGNYLETRFSRDDVESIKTELDYFLKNGADLVLVSGGMSVDADDVTPIAIRETVDEVVSYGSPVLPGAMFMMGYRGDATVLGIPACGMFHRITVLDLVLPRVFIGEKMSRRDISKLGHGGLCLGCKVCTYPVCPFGK